MKNKSVEGLKKLASAADPEKPDVDPKIIEDLKKLAADTEPQKLDVDAIATEIAEAIRSSLDKHYDADKTVDVAEINTAIVNAVATALFNLQRGEEPDQALGILADFSRKMSGRIFQLTFMARFGQ